MPDVSSICLAVLAAGRSERFGTEDKLTAALAGMMLGTIVPDKLAHMNWRKSIVISSTARHPCRDGWHTAGCEIIVNKSANAGIGTSVALAAQHALKVKASGLLICLADMPCIPVDHIERLAVRFLASPPESIWASSDGKRRMPPVVFGSPYVARLAELDADHGGRNLLARAELLELAPDYLVDIDRPEDLELAKF